jgi:predicted lysophospholipase L1 biosynthesis ABC-type transport system permease subunit
MMTVEWEKSAARVRQRQYEFVKVSAGRKVSDGEKRCRVGREVMSEPTAAAMFWRG